MPKKRNKSRKPPFYMLLHKMVDSPAWAELSDKDVRVFLAIARNERSIGGDVHISYSRLPGGTRSVSKAIKNLERLGFIEIVRRGSLAKKPAPSIYRTVRFWMNYKGPKTHD